ncbi:MAG: META domain-containing protein [Daejeonella sp.]|uniref:META domain-containing protein n=1 Tax=Daejeonella sp. JGW-45 TaxID=3034148 RepID=UPI0023EC4C02|nr:META domain-containing protein [Daejeonella sp. JGW-45]
MKICLLSLFVLLASCTAMHPKSDDPKLGESDWKLTSILKRPVNYGDRAFLKFDEKENKVSGKAACNSFFAEYEMIGQKITFTRVGSTKMYCEGIMDDENRIISELQKVTRYEVKANALYLYAGDTLALTYKR